MAEYLELHPEMAHELMVPSGFTQCLIRRYERFLGGQAMLSTQNGAAEKHRWNEETFGALLPGNPAVVFNPSHIDEPNWRELNNFVCRNAVDQVGGEKMAPHYEYKETGERVRVISYRGMKGTSQTTSQYAFTNREYSRSDCKAMAPDVGACGVRFCRCQYSGRCGISRSTRGSESHSQHPSYLSRVALSQRPADCHHSEAT